MYELTKEQVSTFHQKGWLGPLDTFSVQEVESVKKEIEAISQIELLGEQKIRTFHNSYLGFKTHQNHHLWCKSLSNLFESKRVVHRLNQLGEENLLLWRTGIFHRMPGQEEIGWHQSIDYYGYDVDETKIELVFPEGEKPLNLTVWIAFEDITPEMGRLHFANGSHQKRFKPIKVPLGQGVYPEEKYQKRSDSGKNLYSKSFAFDENEWEVESVPVKAGQIMIFTEKVMHKAPYNRSSKERWAINGRYIRPSVTVFPQRLTDNYIDEFGMDTKKHFCILVSGRDDYGINKVVTRV